MHVYQGLKLPMASTAKCHYCLCYLLCLCNQVAVGTLIIISIITLYYQTTSGLNNCPKLQREFTPQLLMKRLLIIKDLDEQVCSLDYKPSHKSVLFASIKSTHFLSLTQKNALLAFPFFWKIAMVRFFTH